VSGWESAGETRRREAVESRWAATRRLVRRSKLIVPTNVPRFVDRAHLRNADAIMLDLEDSIPASEKAAARAALPEAVARVGRGGADVIVRINKPFDLAVADLDAAVAPGVAAICLPKAESGREIELLDAMIGARERARDLPAGAIRLALTIESALGLGRVDEILQASERVSTVDVGAEDFTRDLDVEPTRSGHELLIARQLVVQAARRAGVQALGMATTLANYTDLEALRASIVQAREMGFRGAGCIHPAQVGPLNELFAPPTERVERARRVLAVYEEALAQGRASASIDGEMIDVPVAERARAIVERAEAILAHDARKRAAIGALDQSHSSPSGRG
jgi:citrate lyase subunit beta/citryl-CoA lyase